MSCGEVLNGPVRLSPNSTAHSPAGRPNPFQGRTLRLFFARLTDQGLLPADTRYCGPVRCFVKLS
jgi:hypothetical protein